MKQIRMIIIAAMACLALGCEEDRIIPGTGLSEEWPTEDARKHAGIKSQKVTGSVEVVWKGAEKGSDMGNKPEELLAFLDINAIEGIGNKEPKGEIVYTVLRTDSSLHRQIVAEVQGVYIDPVDHKGWVVAVVLSDTKGCGGNGGTGHADNCEGSGEDDSSHDGGCSHDDTDEGSCSGSDAGQDTHGGDSGGCADEGTDEGGCPDSEGSPDVHGGSPGGDMGNPASGKNCRVGTWLSRHTTADLREERWTVSPGNGSIRPEPSSLPLIIYPNGLTSARR